MVARVLLGLLGACDELGGFEAQAPGEAAQAGVAGVALAGLDVGDPALVQPGVIGELLLGDTEFGAAGLDGQAKGTLRRRGGHPASLPARPARLNDIAVDLALTIRYRPEPMESGEFQPIEAQFNASARPGSSRQVAYRCGLALIVSFALVLSVTPAASAEWRTSFGPTSSLGVELLGVSPEGTPLSAVTPDAMPKTHGQSMFLRSRRCRPLAVA